jgi:hypothetical protein
MTPASFRYLFHARDFHFQIRDVKVVYWYVKMAIIPSV